MASGTTVRARSVVVLASVALLAGATFATVPAIAVSATAFVRVNQVGYPAASAKRAFLMASDVETGATFSLKNGSNATVFSVRDRIRSWLVEHGVSARVRARFHLVRDRRHVFDRRGRPDPGLVAAVQDRHRLRAVLATAHERPLVLRNERDGAAYIPSALRTAPAHLNDQNAMTYLTPHANQTGHFKGDLTPLGVRIDASGGWWDAGDYLKFVQTSSYTEDMLLAGVRDFPGRWAPGRDVGFHRRGEVRHPVAPQDVGRPDRTLYYQVGIGNGNAKTRGDHDIWRLPQADDTLRRERPRVPLHPEPAGVPRGAARLAGQPEPRGARRGRVRDVLPGLPDERAEARGEVPARGRAHLRSGEHGTTGELLTVIPFSFYPESEWRDDLELGATELLLRARGRRPPDRAAAHGSGVLPRRRPRTGRTLTSRARTTPATR